MGDSKHRRVCELILAAVEQRARLVSGEACEQAFRVM